MAERDGRPEERGGEEAAAPPARRRPGRPYIEGVEAGVAAGVVPSTGLSRSGARQPAARAEPEDEDRTAEESSSAGPEYKQGGGSPGDALARWHEEPVPEEIARGVELPDWTDPPTREVPRVLLQPGVEPGPVPRGPVWRESLRDFEADDETFAEMVSGSSPVVAYESARPGEDGLALSPPKGELSAEVPGRRPPRHAASGQRSEPTEPGPGAREARREGSRAHEARSTPDLEPPREETGEQVVMAAAPRRQAKGRNPLVATGTGLVIGAATLGCFLAGPPAVLGIACVVFLLATAELLRTLRKARYEPATVVALLAAPGLPLAAYLLGPSWLALVVVGAVVATFCWYLFGVSRRSVVANVSVTLLVVGWVAVLGSFGGLLLDPASFPLRHGLAYLLGAIEATVAYDVGGYAFGSLLGRHRLAPNLSPNKTVEGLVFGSVSAFAVALLIASQMHPWTMAHAALLGVTVAVVAPIGDLVESMIKRDLRVKDMGNLLPAHGGILDRIDALLFVLPATYLLVRLLHG